MKNYKYSICYPDKPEIEFHDEVLDRFQVVELMKSFNWRDELGKKIEYYSPSLDFSKLDDKHRIIFSGFGTDDLEGFRIMYLVPNDENIEDIYDNDNYSKEKDYFEEFDIPNSYLLLNLFFDGAYEKLELGFNQLKIPIPKPENISEKALGSSIISHRSPNIEPHSHSKTINWDNISDDDSDNYMADLSENWHLFLRFCGIGLAILLIFLAIQFLIIEDDNIGFFIFGPLALFFVLGTIRYEMKLRQRKK